VPVRPDRAASEDAAKEVALRILERGPRTEREVEDRLLARGFERDAVERAIERLRRVSLLDDRAFLRSFLRTELPRRPQGKRLLVNKLKRRGVPAPLLEELDRLLEEEPDLAERSLDTEAGRAEAALAELRKRHAKRDARDRARRLQGALLRRGFDWSMVRDLMRAEDLETNELSE
jgi:regulatory protein